MPDREEMGPIRTQGGLYEFFEAMGFEPVYTKDGLHVAWQPKTQSTPTLRETIDKVWLW